MLSFFDMISWEFRIRPHVGSKYVHKNHLQCQAMHVGFIWKRKWISYLDVKTVPKHLADIRNFKTSKLCNTSALLYFRQGRINLYYPLMKRIKQRNSLGFINSLCLYSKLQILYLSLLCSEPGSSKALGTSSRVLTIWYLLNDKIRDQYTYKESKTFFSKSQFLGSGEMV